VSPGAVRPPPRSPSDASANREETSTHEKTFDVFSDFVRQRLAERHALVRVVLPVSQTIVHQFFEDPRRLLDRKQCRRLQAIRIFVLDLLDAPSVHVHRRARHA